MSRTWMAASIAAALSAFTISYAVASAGGKAPRTVQHLGPLTPTSAPGGWPVARAPSGRAAFAYPEGWRPIAGDPGTVSAALRRRGRIIGYLNATPRGGPETLANWSSFRPAHNREEGDAGVVLLAAARHLRFHAAHGSCIVDGYTSATGSRYRELACIVAGRRATSVIVGSALARRWQGLAPMLRQAVSSFTT